MREAAAAVGSFILVRNIALGPIDAVDSATHQWSVASHLEPKTLDPMLV